MLKATRYTLFTALLTLPLAAQAQGNLDKTLAQMDQTSTQFHSFEANLEWIHYDSVVRENDPPESGMMYCRKDGDGSELGINMTKPGYIVQYKKGTLDKYQASQKQVERFKVPGADAYLALGCGGSGKDLGKSWTVKDLGPEMLTLKDGQKVATEKLDLIPKEEKVRNNITHFVLWIDLAHDIAVQQIMYLPGGDTKTSYYTHIRFNKSVDTKQYTIPTKDVHIVAR